MARFKPKKLRDQSPRAADVDFDFYEWDNEISEGWHPAVVLDAKDEWTNKTKKKHPECFEKGYTGDMPEVEMWKLTFGLDLPGQIGGRVMHYVPFNFPPKVEAMQTVLLREYEDADAEFEAEAKTLLFRTCAVLIEEDTEFQREDGKPSYKVKKLSSIEKLDELIPDWRDSRAGSAVGSLGGEEDLF